MALIDRTVNGFLLKEPKFKCLCRGVEYETLRGDCYNYLRRSDAIKFKNFGSIFISTKSYGHDVEIRGNATPLKFDACRILFKALKEGKEAYTISLHDENIIKSTASTATASSIATASSTATVEINNIGGVTTEDEEIKEIFPPVEFEVLIAEAKKISQNP